MNDYKDLDPDELYYNFPDGSITFFFVPTTKNLYVAPYPATHEDMLVDNNDVFDDVYGDLEWTSRERKSWASRGKALALTNSLLGRIAAVGEDFVIAFWKDPKQYLTSFLDKLFQKYPVFRNKSIVVIAPNVNPISLGKKKVPTIHQSRQKRPKSLKSTM